MLPHLRASQMGGYGKAPRPNWGAKSLEWVRWEKFLSMSEFRNKKNALLKEQIRTIDTDWGFKAIDDFGGIAHGQNSLKLGKRPISRMLRN